MSEKNKKIGYIINAIFLGLIIIADICYMTINCSSYITKTIASALFVFCGAFNFIYCLKINKNKISLFAIFMLLGLIFAMLGDILLIDYFVIGAGLFGLGHVFFFVSYCFLCKVNWKDFVIGAGIFILAFLLIEIYPKFDFNGMKALVIVYALIISLMLGKAISNILLKENRVLNLIILIGASLFFFSDLMLLFHIFGTGGLIFDILCLVTYYPAEFILAFSIFYSNLVLNKQQEIQKNDKEN